MEEMWKNYKPGYYNNKGIFIEYDKSYFCNENKIIHYSLNSILQCKHCNK